MKGQRSRPSHSARRRRWRGMPVPAVYSALQGLAYEDSYAEREKIKPITLGDVTIIDDGKLRKAITAASLGNAMEWF